MNAEPEFTIGIEEEYFLVDRTTRDVAGDPPAEMLTELEGLLGGQVSPEFTALADRGRDAGLRRP